MKTYLHSISRFTISRYLWVSVFITVLLASLLACWLLVNSYHDFTYAKERSKTFQIVNQLILTLNAYGRERGFSHEVIFSDQQNKNNAWHALVNARIDTDQKLNEIPSDILSKQQTNEIQDSLKLARKNIDNFRYNIATDINKTRFAINGFVDASQMYKTAMLNVVAHNLAHSGSSSTIGRLISITLIRDNAGLLAAPFVNVIYFKENLSLNERIATIQRIERIHVAWSLAEYLQDKLPESQSFLPRIQQSRNSYYAQSEMFIRHLNNESKLGHETNINAYQFAKQYRKGLIPIEKLQINYINDLLHFNQREEQQALSKFVTVLLIQIAIITLLAGIVIYIQKHLLKPLSDLNKAASLLANSKESTSGENISEIQSLFNTLSMLDQQMKMQQSIHEKLIKDSEEDPLTKLANRRRFTREALSMLAMSSENPTHLVLIDLDYFKKVNDGWGHVVGDHVLVGIADVLREYSHPQSLATRLGGEEFAIIFPPNIELDLAQQLAILQTKIRQLKVDNEKGGTLSVTASFGVASSTSTHANALKNLLTEADEALYRAKDQGRDQICYF